CGCGGFFLLGLCRLLSDCWVTLGHLRLRGCGRGGFFLLVPCRLLSDCCATLGHFLGNTCPTLAPWGFLLAMHRGGLLRRLDIGRRLRFGWRRAGGRLAFH